MFKCQRDSFLQQLDTCISKVKWLDGEEAIIAAKKHGILDFPRNDEDALVEVVLEDTILFPEGGGQPDDRGTINGIPVIRVIRRGKYAIHFLRYKKSNAAALPLKVGEPAIVHIDWKRRFDHMQQHSAQHLITALADGIYGFSTTSWWLGSEDSYIELETSEFNDEQIHALEDKVNEKIRKNNVVTVEVVNLDSPSWKSVRSRGLPDDVQNDIRIISIDGIDANVCCGTHVGSLSQLQMIKLLYLEKRKGKSLLHFICGERVLRKISDSFLREQKLLKVLQTSTADLVASAEKLSIALKQSKKSCQTLSKDLASLEANRFHSLDTNGMSKNGVLFFYHREDVDLDFGMALLRELGETKDNIILVILKTEPNLGHLLLRGGENIISVELITCLGEEVCKVLEGKGSLRGNLYQAKVTKVSRFTKALKLANKFVDDFIVPPQQRHIPQHFSCVHSS